MIQLPEVIFEFENMRIVQVSPTVTGVGVAGVQLGKNVGIDNGKWIHFVVEYQDGRDRMGTPRWQTDWEDRSQTLARAIVELLLKHGVIPP